MPLSMCLVNVEKELWTELISSNIRNSTFEIITITVMEIVLIQLLFFNVGSKQINENENTEYHGTLIPFKSQLYPKPGSSIFLLFGSWSLEYHGTFKPFKSQLYSKEFHFFLVRVIEFSIASSYLSKVKNFPIILPSNLSRRSTFAWKR